MNTPVAVNGCVASRISVTADGVTEIHASTGAVTVSVADPLSPVVGSIAVIVAVPSAVPVATPFDPLAFDTVAVPVADQVVVAVTSRVDPSVYVPVAWKALVSPAATLGVEVDTVMLSSAGAVTVSDADPLSPVTGSVAVIVVVPMAVPVASPLEAAAFEMVAAPLLDAHVAESVRLCVVPSLYVPVAWKLVEVPTAMLALAGVSAMDWRMAGVAVTVVCPLICVVESVAVTVEIPRASAVTIPDAPGVFDTTMSPFEDAQIADWVTSAVEPSV